MSEVQTSEVRNQTVGTATENSTVKNEEKKKYKCSLCGAEYSSRSGLKYHLEHAHGQKQDVEKLEIEKTEPPKQKKEEKEEKKMDWKWIAVAIVVLIVLIIGFFMTRPQQQGGEEYGGGLPGYLKY